MGKGRTGGELAAPIVADFMKVALKDKPATPFRVPKGIELIPISAKTGQRDLFGEDGVILEAFKPGEEPSEGGQIIGNQVATSNGVPIGPSPDAARPESEAVIEGGLTTGTGGLY
jgi:penicillin-binding protein 1A